MQSVSAAPAVPSTVESDPLADSEPGQSRTVASAPAGREVDGRPIRPLAAKDIRGLAHVGAKLLTLDTRTGRVALVDPRTDDTGVVNDGATTAFLGARGLAFAEGAVWFAAADGVRRAVWEPGEPMSAGDVVLDVRCEAVSVIGDRLYLVVGDALREHALDANGRPDPATRRSIGLHGVGAKGLSATTRNLWLTDDVEQTVYCLDRSTLQTRFTVITPLEGPTAIAASDPPASDPPEGDRPEGDRPEGDRPAGDLPAGDPQSGGRFGMGVAGVPPLPGQEPGQPVDEGAAARVSDEADILHIAYYEDEPYLADNPWIDPCWEVRYRDRALVHRLHVHHDPQARAAWSTGHRLVMHYYVEVHPEADQAPLTDVRWRMALPLDTPRQRVVAVEPIGLPFEVEDEPDGLGASQPVAVFTIPRLDAGTRLVLGWRATLEVFGIKHQIRAEDLADVPLGPWGLGEELAARYLGDDEDLDLDSPEIAAAAAAALGGETNPWLAARRIRTWVYDRLEYEMGNADSPIGVLARGTGSCGEYVSTIMALLRRVGIACRVAGRYKCPYQPWNRGPLYPDFNHVWVDVHLPPFGWLPLESNPDDVVDGGPYPDRFFFGLPWRHIEVGKDISFEKVLYRTEGGSRRRIGARRLSRNHIRFDVLAELAPAGS